MKRSPGASKAGSSSPVKDAKPSVKMGKATTGKKRAAAKKTSPDKVVSKAVQSTTKRPKAGTSTRSTKAKSASNATASPPPSKSGDNGRMIEVHPEPRKKVKTHLSDADLKEFRDLLLNKRRELVGDVNHMESEALREGSGSGGGSSTMPIHMADLGSDTWEQELTLGLIANERGLIREIDEALARIEDRTYGVCLATHKRITKARLRVKPWAKYCIEYARQLERGLV